jgi:MFS family permease
MKFWLVMLLSALSQAAAGGARLDFSLAALAHGGSATTVGLLNTVWALLPALLAVQVGRLIDRIGMRVPLAAGIGATLAGTLLNFIWPAQAAPFPTLYVGALLVGAGQMVVQVGVNNATGALSTPQKRASYYSWLSLATLAGSSIGILIAGFAIEHAGHRAAFLACAAIGAFALVPLALQRVLPAPAAAAHPAARGGHALELLRRPGLATVFWVSAIVSMSWDLYQIIVPIYGHEIGLPAATIGIVMACFPAGNFAMRALVPLLVRRFREWTLITATLAGIGLGFLLLPLAQGAAALMLITFLLGGGFGFSFPASMALIFSLAPGGRQGEAIGIRATMQNLSHVVAPTAMGLLSTLLGLLPVVWMVAGSMFLTGWFAHRSGRRHGRTDEAR